MKVDPKKIDNQTFFWSHTNNRWVNLSQIDAGQVGKGNLYRAYVSGRGWYNIDKII